MPETAAAPPPEDAAAQAEQLRQAAELAALTLFASSAAQAAPGVPLNEVDQRILISIVTNLARGIIHNTLLAATVAGIAYLLRPPPEQVEEAVSTIVPEVTQALGPSINELRRLDKGTPLTSARLAASSFATRAYSAVTESAGRHMPIPPELEDLELHKTWITMLDDKVRPLHRRLHGRTKNMDEDFWRWPDSGAVLGYPGDMRAPPAAWINCRCTLWLSWASKKKATEAVAAGAEFTESLHPRDTEGRFRHKPGIKARTFHGNQWTKYGRTRTGPPATTVADAKSRGFTDGPYYHATDHANEILANGFVTKGAESWEVQDPGSIEEFKRFGSVNQVWLGKSREDVAGYGSDVIEVWVQPGKAKDAEGMTLGGGFYVSDPADAIPIQPTPSVESLDASELTERQPGGPLPTWVDDANLAEVARSAAEVGFTKLRPIPRDYGPGLGLLGLTDPTDPDTLMVGAEDMFLVSSRGNFMPEAQDDIFRYTVLHEAGHRLATLKHFPAAPKRAPQDEFHREVAEQRRVQQYRRYLDELQFKAVRQAFPDSDPATVRSQQLSNSLDPAMGVSEYGRTSPTEAYAEMYAAFQMGSQTPIVQAYAQHEGWERL
jgi:Phage Mu protein F like protein